MELLSELWDKTTDVFTAFSENVSEGLVRLFGSSNERRVRQMRAQVAVINELEPKMKALSADALLAKTAEFRERRARGNRSTICCPRRLRRRVNRDAGI